MCTDCTTEDTAWRLSQVRSDHIEREITLFDNVFLIPLTFMEKEHVLLMPLVYSTINIDHLQNTKPILKDGNEV